MWSTLKILKNGRKRSRGYDRKKKKREVRLSESRLLREKYLEKYSWEELIRSLVKRLNSLAFGK